MTPAGVEIPMTDTDDGERDRAEQHRLDRWADDGQATFEDIDN